FRYDPPNGFDLYRRELAVINNQPQPISARGTIIKIQEYQVASDLNSISTITGLASFQLPGLVGAKFAVSAGGLKVNQNINTPLWSLAMVGLDSLSKQESFFLFGTASNPLAVSQSTSFPFSYCCGSQATDNALRPTIQTQDYAARTVYLGAAIRITIPRVINTDVVLEEPPKHTLWCEKDQPGCEGLS